MHHVTTRRAASALLALMLVLCLLPAALADNLGVVVGGKLHLRAAPSLDAEILATYDSGSHVEVLGVEGHWYEVETYDGRTGYMEASYIFISSAGRVENGDSYVNLRNRPSRDAEIIGRFYSGTLLTMLSEDGGGWIHVDIEGERGFMDASFIEAIPEDQTGHVNTPASMVESTAEPPSMAVNPYELAINGDNSVVQQVGQAESDVYVDGTLAYTIYYPLLGIAPADEAIGIWVEETVQQMRALAADLPEHASIDLTVHYDSYLVADRYIGVLEAGLLDSTALAHPADMIATVNADIRTDSLLTYTDIFGVQALPQVLTMLEAKLAALEGNPVEGMQLDEAWLVHSLLTPRGVAVVLPRGEFLASVWGTQSVVLPYETLAADGLLALALDAAVPEATPAPDEPATVHVTTGERVIDPTKPMVALTFDDGPSDHTLAILNLLEENGGRGTFCMVGNRIANYQDVVAQVARQGSEIATHTWAHKELTKLSPQDIALQLQHSMDAIEAITSRPVTVLRPPYGSINGDVRSVAQEMGLRIVTWSIDTEDWKTENADMTYAAIMDHVQNGSIILCHDLKASTAEAMLRVIPELVQRGYQLVTVSELLQFTESGGQPGVVYYHLDTSRLEGEG